MKQPEDTDRRASPLEVQKAVRKPYRKPEVRHERCDKVVSTQGSCHFNRKIS